MTAVAETMYEAFVTARALAVLDRARESGTWAGHRRVIAAMAAVEGCLKRSGDAAAIDTGTAVQKLAAVIGETHGEEVAHWVRDGWEGEGHGF